MKVFFLYLDCAAVVAVFHRCHCIGLTFERWDGASILPNLICLQQGVPSSGTSGNLRKASSSMLVLVIHSVFLTYDTHVSSHFFTACFFCPLIGEKFHILFFEPFPRCFLFSRDTFLVFLDNLQDPFCH